MGCSKLAWVPCPKAGQTAPLCFGCDYYLPEWDSAAIQYMPSVAKTIDQFTNEELLAEIKRRMGA